MNWLGANDKYSAVNHKNGVLINANIENVYYKLKYNDLIVHL